jgi:hypothetical protein
MSNIEDNVLKSLRSNMLTVARAAPKKILAAPLKTKKTKTISFSQAKSLYPDA